MIVNCESISHLQKNISDAILVANLLPITKNKKSKNKFDIKDGIMRYIVAIEDNIIKCQCSQNKYCIHIIKTLMYLDINQIYYSFIEHLAKPLSLCIQNNIDDSNKKNSIICEHLSNVIFCDCGICLIAMSPYDDLIKCLECKKVLHKKCDMQWRSRKHICNGCIYCRH